VRGNATLPDAQGGRRTGHVLCPPSHAAAQGGGRRTCAPSPLPCCSMVACAGQTGRTATQEFWDKPHRATHHDPTTASLRGHPPAWMTTLRPKETLHQASSLQRSTPRARMQAASRLLHAMPRCHDCPSPDPSPSPHAAPSRQGGNADEGSSSKTCMPPPFCHTAGDVQQPATRQPRPQRIWIICILFPVVSGARGAPAPAAGTGHAQPCSGPATHTGCETGCALP